METYIQRQMLEKRLIPQGVDPRHVEGYMRLAYSTFSQLSWPEIKREIKVGLACIKEGGIEAAERNAKSFGL